MRNDSLNPTVMDRVSEKGKAEACWARPKPVGLRSEGYWVTPWRLTSFNWDQMGRKVEKHQSNGWRVTVKLYLMLFVFLPDSTALSSPTPHAFQINFNSLYTTLYEQQNSDHATLLLYTLLHQNSNVRTYMLARTDMENLVNILSFRVTNQVQKYNRKSHLWNVGFWIAEGTRR